MAQTLGKEVAAGPVPVPIKLFRGYDSVARGLLTTSPVTGEFENSGVTSGVKIQVCESLSQLADALEIDASLSVSYLKAVDVTAKMEFARKLDVTARSVSIVVYAKHGVGTWDVTEVRLKDEREMKKPPTAPTDAGSAAEFVRSYGDSFVKSVTLGGEYFAVYIFNTETREQQQSLALSLKAELKASAVSVKAESQVKLTNFLKTTKTNWTLKQGITGIVNPTFPDEDKLISYALGFSAIPLDGPVATNIKIGGYEGLSGWSTPFAKIKKNRSHFLNSTSGLLQKLARLSMLSSQIGWLNGIYSRYNYTGDAALGAFSTKVDADLEAIDAQVEAWQADPGGDFVMPVLPSLKEGEPVLNYSDDVSPAWGGTSASPWNVDSVGDLIRNRTRVKSIQLSTGKFDPYTLVGRMVIEYVSDKHSWTESYGDGQVITVQQKLDFQEGQSPNRFETRSGTYLDWLKIYRSDGRQSTEAGGPGGRKNPDWQVPDGWFFVGFAGRSGGIIDQLQVRYAKLEPAKMVQTA